MVLLALSKSSVYDNQALYGNQETFLKRSLESIAAAVTYILSNKENPSLLENTLRFLAEKRHAIAVEMNSESAEEFGAWIPSFCEFSSGRVYTPLNGAYKDYGKLAREILLNDAEHHLKPNSCTVSDNGFHHIGLSVIPTETSPCPFNLVLAVERKSQFNPKFIGFESFISLMRKMRALPKKHDRLYLKYNVFKIAGKLHLLSAILFVNANKKTKAVGVAHGESGVMKPFLEFLTPLFKQAVDWQQSDGLTALIDKIAEIHFFLAQLVLVKRGSASIVENLTRAILKLHGFKLVSFPDKMRIDLEAHIHPIDKFKEMYINFYTKSYNQ